jgi:hypothetical protein
MDSNHLRMNGAFTERWARQCPACPNWRRSEVLIPSGFCGHPSRFERAPDSCPVTSPCLIIWRKAAVLIRNAQGIQSASDGCRPPGRSTFRVVWEWCARLDSNQRSACYEQVAFAAKLRARKLVRVAGFDPATSRFRAEGSTRLSYTLLSWRSVQESNLPQPVDSGLASSDT